MPWHSHSLGRGQLARAYPPERSGPTCGPWAGGMARLGEPPPESRPLPAPSQAGQAVMCHSHCQVAGSQAGGAVMSGEGSGQAAGQERLPLGLLQAAAPFRSPLLWRSLPYLGAAQIPPPPKPSVLPPFTSHAPCAPLSPQGWFPSQSPAGAPGCVECWKNNLSLRL